MMKRKNRRKFTRESMDESIQDHHLENRLVGLLMISKLVICWVVVDLVMSIVVERSKHVLLLHLKYELLSG